MSKQVEPSSGTPRVFFSYSWTSDAHQRRVVELAERMRADGVDVVLDVWDLKPGHDVPQYMEQMVTDASIKRVLLLCDPRYAEKADERAGGVGAESQIVSPKVYGSVKQEKFIPVIVERKLDGTVAVPTYLSGRKWIDLSEPGTFADEYMELLRTIYEAPARPKPALGAKPAFVTAPDAMSAMTHLLQGTSPAALARTGTPVQVAKRLMAAVVTDVRDQRLLQDVPGHLDETIASKIVEMKGLRDATITAWMQMLESGDDEGAADELVAFFENLAPLGDWPDELNTWNDGRGDHIRFFNWELWLYLIALLVRERRWEVVRRVLNTPLCYTAKHGGYAAHGYGSLNKGLPALEYRKQRLGLNRMSLAADLIKERADRNPLTFESLMEADFLLYLRDILAEEQAPYSWHPRTLVYIGPFRSPFPVFVRWSAGRDLEGIGAILRLGDLAGVQHRLKLASEAGRLGKGAFGNWDTSAAVLTGLYKQN